MTTRHDCGSDHQGQVLAEARCAWEAALVNDLVTHAAALDKPVTPQQVRDLWAHARTIRDDGTEAARWARTVLDLGWRPTIAEEGHRG